MSLSSMSKKSNCPFPITKISMFRSPGVVSSSSRHREERLMFLARLLYTCTSFVANGNTQEAFRSLEQISQMASPNGDIVQRIAAYFIKALADRMLKRWPGLFKAIHSTQTCSIPEINVVQRLFYEFCPFLKLAYVVTNQAIVEAMEGERMVHIVDLNCFEPAQLIDLMHTLSARPDGAPSLRITGVQEQKEVLEHMGIRLMGEAEKLGLPFQFIPVAKKVEDLDRESLRVQVGEAVAVSSVLQLHTLLATDELIGIGSITNQGENSSSSLADVVRQRNHLASLGDRIEEESSVTSTRVSGPKSLFSPPSLLAASPKMASFLSTMFSISPKVMVITEQESDHNAAGLEERVKEGLNYYSSVFDCLEVTLSKAPMERQKLEKVLFGEEIKSIIACEGSQRKERHEKLERWIPRMELAGFRKVAMSYQGKLLASRLLRGYGFDGYKIKDENGCLVTCWNNKTLYSMSSWKCRALRH